MGRRIRLRLGLIKRLVNIRGGLCNICQIISCFCLVKGFLSVYRGRFWGGNDLESEKGVLEEKELLGVNIIGVFLPEEVLGLIRLLVCLSLLLKEIMTVPSIF